MPRHVTSVSEVSDTSYSFVACSRIDKARPRCHAVNVKGMCATNVTQPCIAEQAVSQSHQPAPPLASLLPPPPSASASPLSLSHLCLSPSFQASWEPLCRRQRRTTRCWRRGPQWLAEVPGRCTSPRLCPSHWRQLWVAPTRPPDVRQIKHYHGAIIGEWAVVCLWRSLYWLFVCNFNCTYIGICFWYIYFVNWYNTRV